MHSQVESVNCMPNASRKVKVKSIKSAYSCYSPVCLLIPRVGQPCAPGNSTGCAFAHSIAKSAPDNNQQGHSIVSNEAPNPTLEV